MNDPASSPAAPVRYAGSWKRLTAYGYDAILVSILSYLASWLLGDIAQAQEISIEGAANADIQALIAAGLLPPGTDAAGASHLLWDTLSDAVSMADLVIALLVSAIYNIYFLAGSWQATPGKRFCGIHVIHASGRPLTLQESALRHAASGISMGILGGFGYLSMWFTKERLALHDMLCSTRVVMGTPEPR